MDNVVVKPHVGTRVELASIPGLARHFLGVLSNVVQLCPVFSVCKI